MTQKPRKSISNMYIAIPIYLKCGREPCVPSFEKKNAGASAHASVPSNPAYADRLRGRISWPLPVVPVDVAGTE